MRGKRILPLLLMLCVTLAACAQAANSPAGADPAASGDGEGGGSAQTEGTVTTCRIVDGAEEGELLLADLNGAENGVYMLSVKDIPLTVDGQAADCDALADGMTVEVNHSGTVLESYPAQFAQVYSLRAQTPPGGGFTDLCGLWLKVLDDLWNTDPGLNGMESGGTVPYVGVDLSRAPGDLTAAEKSAVAWRFGQLHGAEALMGTFDDLAEQGYLDRQQLFWEDGVLFSIAADESQDGAAYSLPVLKFDAEKWRGGDGAYFFNGCTCVWPESGIWTDYSVGSKAIS